MSYDSQKLADELQQRLGDACTRCIVHYGEVTIEVSNKRLIEVCTRLRDDAALAFEQLVDLCGVDYLTYGQTEWATEDATAEGFSRGVATESSKRHHWQGQRFAVVYHLISYRHNHRVRVRTFVSEELPVVDSVAPVWAAASWYEREAFDLFGIIFEGHPDLRRLLTDYGFIGHPFRKDFPLSGRVEVRYDPTKGRVAYEPVSIEPRVLVPRVIRDDERYTRASQKES
ncbi:MAG: NADH-quinone oxidoreductase subunit C [Pseudomonadota bacterium]